MARSKRKQKKATLPTTKTTTKKTTLKTTKPCKKDRNKIIKKNKMIEDERNKELQYRAEKQQIYRKKLANSNITKSQTQEQEQKKQNKLAKKRNKARINAPIRITKKESDYGDYYWIDSVPICDMTQLLTQFKTTEFRNNYDNNSAEVNACNNEANTDYQPSTYWMLDQNNGKTIGDIAGNWMDNRNTSSTNNISLNNFMTKVGIGLNEYLKEYGGLKEDINFITKTPGFVQTTIPTHQELHLDTKNVNFKKPGHSYILHVPLDYEGMHLRLGEINKKCELKHGLIHIPFGSGILLHYTHLHAGHYGNPRNFRFHAVFSDKAWNGSELMPLKTYLQMNKINNDAITTDFETYINNENKKDTLDELETTTAEKLHRTTYYKHLIKFNPSPEFLPLVEKTIKKKD